ncbi:uncharacterized protein LOC127363447 [Dicentrarchus labrax]|uniref:uncharacterized protein LOC127363447 n=1 Tax=Dicentrarchus labrax TaxID=13489 RepID=UPI0021F5512C|nr:uncharacterized protein LOC127363447 [Dicentrarchus labrax]
MNGSTCNIDSFWQSDAVYWCESGSGDFSNAVNVTIQKTDIILVSPVHPVTEGDSVSLSCRLRRQTFESNVFFYRNEKLIQNDTRRELNISAVSKSDEGFYKCQYSQQVSAQSWMSVNAVPRPESSSSPVPLIVGLVCGIVLIILLLLLYRYRPSKGSCCIRSNQSESINQDFDTNHVPNQNETQPYSTLLHGDTSLYESMRRPEDTENSCKTAIHAFITSRIDYCNNILYGTPSKTLNKLEYIQNSAARLLVCSSTPPPVITLTPVLQNLHWLPVPQRIQFKILLLTHKALHNQAPSYLTDLLHRHNPSRSLRSSDANLLTPPPWTKHRTWGNRAFSVAAPSLWNSLPKQIRDCTDLPAFKSLTKTHLFKIAFNV